MFRHTGKSWLGFKGLIIFQIILMNLSKGLADNIGVASLITNIDEKIDPCLDFHEFVCGNYPNKPAMLQEMMSDNRFDALKNEVDKQLRPSVEHRYTQNDLRAFKILNAAYNACMNRGQIENSSVHEFVDITDSLGGWPVLAGDSWNETAFDWRDSSIKLHAAGFGPLQFVVVFVTKDIKNNSRNLVHVEPARLGISALLLAHGLEHDVVKAYDQYMVEYAVQLGANRERAVEELRAVLDFDVELAKISVGTDRQCDKAKLYNPMSVAELQKSYPFPNNGLNWLDFLNGILHHHACLRDDDIVIVSSPSYLKDLLKLLEVTPKRTQANHAFWAAAEMVVDRLSERVGRVRKEFIGSIGWIPEDKSERWQYCLNQVKDHMNVAVGALYVRKHVPKGTKENVTEIVADVARSFKGILEKVSWMANSTKKSALEKLEAMRSVVGYPDELADDENLNDYYNGLQILLGSYLRTSLILNVFHEKHILEKLNKPAYRTDWTFHSDAATVNAKYIPGDNTILLPAALLQEKYFNKDNPQFMNYAGIGSIAGFEMMHGFDDEGRQFDKDGNLLNWWDDNSDKEYLKRNRCFVEQYRNYAFKTFSLNITEEVSMAENLSDNYGVKMAYYAYEAWEKRNGPEPRPAGLEKYSPRQLFWMSSANLWCANFNNEYLQDLISMGVRIPYEYRVNGPLSNIPEFARDFECPKGSPMNPENKCTFW